MRQSIGCLLQSYRDEVFDEPPLVPLVQEIAQVEGAEKAPRQVLEMLLSRTPQSYRAIARGFLENFGSTLIRSWPRSGSHHTNEHPNRLRLQWITN